jgi:hypothetical protein
MIMYVVYACISIYDLRTSEWAYTASVFSFIIVGLVGTVWSVLTTERGFLRARVTSCMYTFQV